MTLQSRTKAALEVVEQFIKECREALFIEASTIAWDYWDASHQHADGPRELRARYILRVARGKAGVVIQWKLIWYVWDSKQNRWVQRSKYIKRGKGNLRHKMTSFPKANDWERPIIESIERRAEAIRRKSHWLARLAQVMSNHPDLERERRENALMRKAIAASVLEVDEELPELQDF